MERLNFGLHLTIHYLHRVIESIKHYQDLISIPYEYMLWKIPFFFFELQGLNLANELGQSGLGWNLLNLNGYCSYNFYSNFNRLGQSKVTRIFSPKKKKKNFNILSNLFVCVFISIQIKEQQRIKLRGKKSNNT